MKNRLLSILISLIILCLCIGFFFTSKEKYSQEENRYLSDFSIEKLGEYVSDYLPFRKTLLSMKNNFEKLIGRTLINGVYIGKDGYLIGEYKDSNKKDYIIDAINNYAQDKTVDFMLVPDSIFINEEKLRRVLLNNEKQDIQYFYDKCNTNNIDLEQTFLSHKEENLFYRTDHHWTTHGAYLAYQKYMDNIGMIPADDYRIKTVSEDFLGTSSSILLGLAEPESIEIYEYDNVLRVEYVREKRVTDTLYNDDYLEKKDKYAMFLDGNHALIHITNESVSGGSIVVIKNSFANCFIPFIVNNFRDVYVIDLRYYNESVSELVKENGIERTLILFNINNLYSDLSIIKLK